MKKLDNFEIDRILAIIVFEKNDLLKNSKLYKIKGIDIIVFSQIGETIFKRTTLNYLKLQIYSHSDTVRLKSDKIILRYKNS